MKEELYSYMDTLYPQLMDRAEAIFARPELRFEERFACATWIDWLHGRGWQTETGVGGLETAFRALYQKGEGGPSIGLLVEYDALPMGHGCGHHLQGAVLLAAAEAIRHSDISGPYRLVIYGTPGEEGGQGKDIMAKNGCFRDIDVALMTHGAANTTVDVKSLSNIRLEAHFRGVAAHESLMPEAARSGLDALVLAMQGLEFLRGHVRPEVRLSSTILSCPGMPGYTGGPDAVGAFSVRTYQPEDEPELERRLRDILQGAALMSGTAVHITKTRHLKGKLPSLSLNQIIMDNVKALDAPRQLAFRERTGSTDFSEVTHLVPGAVSRFPLVPEGATSHSQAFLDCGTGEPARDTVAIGAQIMAATIYDLLTEPHLLQEVRREFETRRDQYTQLVSEIGHPI